MMFSEWSGRESSIESIVYTKKIKLKVNFSFDFFLGYDQIKHYSWNSILFLFMTIKVQE